MSQLLQYTIFGQAGKSEPVFVEFSGKRAAAMRAKIEHFGPIEIGRVIPELGVRVDRLESEQAPWEAR